jgi:hypothetical protein
LFPTGNTKLNSASAFVSPLTPYLSDEVGGHLADGLSKVHIHIDIVAIGFAVDDYVVDIWEVQTPVVVGTITVIGIVEGFKRLGPEVGSAVQDEVVAIVCIEATD